MAGTPVTTEYLSRKAVARYLEGLGICVTHRTLENYGYRGGGPKYELFSPTKALYTKADVDAWIEERFRKNRK